MRTFLTALSLVGLPCVVLPAGAEAQREVTTRVHVPAGDLNDAVESLAKQAGVNVMYPGDLLDRRTTAGVDGTLPPKEAFAKLLQNTSLTFTEEHGALLIAKASASEPAAAGSQPLVPGAMIAGTAAIWVRREFRIDCVECDFQLPMREVLQRLGATEISTGFQSASFLSLAPAGDGDRANAAQSGTASHWETVVFANEREGRWRRNRELGVSRVVYDILRTRLLTLFTTRNFTESEGRFAVDVLMPGTASAASECHRVIQGSGVQRYCGSPDQWLGLEVRVGFSCRNEGNQDELCASSEEWKRAGPGSIPAR